MSHGLLTADELDRLNRKAKDYAESNPFKQRLLARLGCLHAPSTVTDDKHVMAEEPCVELMRDLPKALTESGSPF